MLDNVAVAGEVLDKESLIYREAVAVGSRSPLLRWDSFSGPQALGSRVRRVRLGMNQQSSSANLT